MWTGLVKSTGIQYPDSHSILALGWSHRAWRSKELCRCRVQRWSTSRRRTQPRRGSGWGVLWKRFEEEKKNHSPSHATIKEPSCWQRTINSMQGRSTSICDIISSVRQSKMEKFKWSTYWWMITYPTSSPSICRGQNLPSSWNRWAWGSRMVPKPSIGAEVCLRSGPRYGTMGMSAGSRRGIMMTRGSLYRIWMIVVVMELGIEEDHCIEYKWS